MHVHPKASACILMHLKEPKYEKIFEDYNTLLRRHPLNKLKSVLHQSHPKTYFNLKNVIGMTYFVKILAK